MAAVVLLLIPGELLLAGMRKQVLQVEGTANKAVSVAEQAQQTADETARSLEDIRRSLVDRQVAELEHEIDVYRSIANDPRREVLVNALRKATHDGLISRSGLRVPVWNTEVHYRFIIDEPFQGELHIQLEDDAGSILSTTAWEPDVSPEDFYQSLVYAVRDAGHDLGTGLNLPTQSIEEIAEMLAEVTQLRSQELNGYRDILRKIIERRNGWYFTEENVLVADDLRYSIAVDRLDELDWEEHLVRKGWYSAPSAIQFARRFYGVHPADDRPDNEIVGNGTDDEKTIT